MALSYTHFFFKNMIKPHGLALSVGDLSGILDGYGQIRRKVLMIDDMCSGKIRWILTDLKDHIDMRFHRIETDVAEVKTALKEKWII